MAVCDLIFHPASPCRPSFRFSLSPSHDRHSAALALLPFHLLSLSCRASALISSSSSSSSLAEGSERRARACIERSHLSVLARLQRENERTRAETEKREGRQRGKERRNEICTLAFASGIPGSTHHRLLLFLPSFLLRNKSEMETADSD